MFIKKCIQLSDDISHPAAPNHHHILLQVPLVIAVFSTSCQATISHAQFHAKDPASCYPHICQQYIPQPGLLFSLLGLLFWGAAGVLPWRLGAATTLVWLSYSTSQGAKAVLCSLYSCLCTNYPAPTPKWRVPSLCLWFNLNTSLIDKCHIYGVHLQLAQDTNQGGDPMNCHTPLTNDILSWIKPVCLN